MDRAGAGYFARVLSCFIKITRERKGRKSMGGANFVEAQMEVIVPARDAGLFL